jgi:hypothetical protein
LKRQALLILFAVFVGLLTFSVSRVVFRNAAITSDEHAYVMQAYTFSEGKISRPLPPASDFFIHEMMIMDRDAGWLSRYPPGHAIWLIPGVLFDQPRIMVSVAAGLSVYILGNIGFLFQLSPALLPLLLLLSPFFIFMNGTLLSHTSGLPAAALMLFAYIYWKEKDKPLFALIAGLAWSALFINRTFTGLLIALPFALDAVWDLFKSRDKRTFLATVLFAGSASVGVFFYILYNYLAVNDPLLPTYLYYAPSDKLGFGLRNEGYFPIIHSFSLGLTYLGENLVLLDKWLFGFRGSLLVALALAIWGWRQRWSLLCLTAIVSVLTGYIFFWFGGIHNVGPVYYFELLPFILLAAGFGEQKIITLFASPSLAKKVVFAAGMVAVAVMSFGFMWQEGRHLRTYQSIIGQYQHVVSTAPENSLILVEGFSGMNFVHKGTSFNPRGLESNPLMVAAGKQHPRIILDLFPGRNAYRLYRKGDKLMLDPYTNTGPIIQKFSAIGTGATTGTNEKDADGTDVRSAREGQDKEGWLVLCDKRLLVPGKYRLTMDVVVDKLAAHNPAVLQIIAGDDPVIIVTENFEKQGEFRPYVLDFPVKSVEKIELRIYYGGKGDISIGDIEIRELRK